LPCFARQEAGKGFAGQHTSAGEEIPFALRNVFSASTRHETPHNRTVPSHDPDNSAAISTLTEAVCLFIIPS